MKNNFVLIRTIVLTVILSSCSSNDPSASAKEIIENKVFRESRGYFKLINMQKNDAVLSKISGVENYSVKYSAEIECIKDGGWIATNSDGTLIFGFKFLRDHYDEKNAWTQLKVGDKFKINDEITIEKHEQGWVEL